MNHILSNTVLSLALPLVAISVGATAAETTLISDPNFPLVQLPATFDSQRSTKQLGLAT